MTFISQQNISPGAVDTEMLRGVTEVQVPALTDQHIADAVIYALGMPEGAEVIQTTCYVKLQKENFMKHFKILIL